MKIPFQQYWDLLAAHIRPQSRRFTLLTVLLFSSIGLQVVNPQIMRYFIDTATSGGSNQALSIAAFAFIGIALVQQVVGVGAAYVGENVAWTATNALRAELARHCLRLDMTFHNDSSPGELIERIDGDVAELSNFFSQMVVRVLGNILLILGIILALFIEEWSLGLAFLGFAAATLLLLNQVRGIAIPHQKKLRESIADFFGYLEERLAGTEDIRSNGAVDFVLLGMYKLAYVVFGHMYNAWRLNLVVRAVAGLMLTFGISMAFTFGYYLLQDGLITLGTVYLIVYYTNLIRRPIREITQQVESMQNIGAATERLRDLRAIQSKLVDGPGCDLPVGALGLTVEGLHFGYEVEEPVLKGISFDLKPGKALGLLGRTGSGKTTMARLVFRLYDPVSGSIRLGGTDLRTPTVKQLRQRVAIVTQDVQLYQASVRDNITFFDRSIPDERILEVIQDVGLREWFEALPRGLDTKLETGGRDLSAGQGQLLALARVFLRDPGLVILDEASSRLDPATEQLIERAVDKLLENRTAVIIAHRLGTLDRTDEIMILGEGQIMEYGDRQTLADDPNSRFASLLKTGLEEVLV